MIYYNQNDYAHVPYPSEVRPQSNIKTSGCGVCSACMVVENLTEHKLSVEECAKFSISVGGRDNHGTDMEKLAPPLCARFGLTFEATDDKEKVLEFLNNNRGMVIANPGGDREGHVGLFTTSGHYIVLVEARQRTVRIGNQRARIIGSIGATETILNVTDVKCSAGDVATFDLDPLYARGVHIEYR